MPFVTVVSGPETTVPHVPGNVPQTPVRLLDRGRAELLAYPTASIRPATVSGITVRDDELFDVVLSDGALVAHRVVLATGVRDVFPDVRGFDEHYGASAFHCPACEQQEAGSAFLAKLNAGKETVAGVDYTVIQSDKDEVVTPYTSAFLSGRNVTNLLLQNQCILDQGEHLSMPYDHIADADVLNALDPAHPVTPACTPVLPVAGG